MPIKAACFIQFDSTIKVGCSLNNFIRPSSCNCFAYRFQFTHVVKIIIKIKNIRVFFVSLFLSVFFVIAEGDYVSSIVLLLPTRSVSWF